MVIVFSIFLSIFSVSIGFLCAASGEIKMFIIKLTAVVENTSYNL